MPRRWRKPLHNPLDTVYKPNTLFSMTLTLHWQTIAVAGNPKVNPLPTDRRTVLCSGWTRMEAASAEEAANRFQDLFPQDRIIAIT